MRKGPIEDKVGKRSSFRENPTVYPVSVEGLY